MEVRCSSCATEYEFDDALVSARGTSVKCTNCGHQFRVHPIAGMTTHGGVAETWIVRDARGKETVFKSLRDLQQAIVRGHVDPKHEMSHAGAPFRAMQDIYELQTFFNAARLKPPKPAPRTLLGVGRDGPVPGGAPPVAEGRVSTPPPRKRSAHEPTQERITPVAGMPAVRAPLAADTAPVSDVKPQLESGARPAPRERPATPVPPPARLDKDKVDTKDVRPKKDRPGSGAPASGLPWQQLSGLREAEAEVAPEGRAGARWIVAVVVAGGLVLIGATLWRNYRSSMTVAEAPVVDERVPQLLEQARVALARGDFENARAELAKASLLAETDAKVAGAKAQLELAMAEQVWLEQRVGSALEAAAAEKPPARPKTKAAEASAAEAAEKRAIEKKQLELSFQDRIGKAKTAVAAAAERAPDALEVVRARVDALRLTNQLKEARSLVGSLSAQASDPDNAYSLGALDLSEGPSGYTSAIDRLRVAARPEEALGKARALLVYVLALSGDAAAASAELDKLQTLAPRHRALPALRELVDVAQSRTPAAPAVKAPAAPAAPSAAASPPPARAASSAVSEADISTQLNHAASLHRAGDLGGAEKVYQGVIKKSPNNISALSGLGDIARQRRANGTAAAYYDQILKLDRNHVGALMARADLYWHAGNRVLAVALYRRALGQVGQSDPLGQRALRRIEEFDREGAGTGAGEGASETEPATGEDPSAAPGEATPEPPPDTEEDPEPSSPPSDSTSASPSKTGTSKPSTAKPPSAAKPAPAPSEEPPSGEGSQEEAPAEQPENP